MQVVITVPDDEYKAIKNSARPMYYAEHLIKEGTPYQETDIDEIRAKIEKLKAWIPGCTMYGSNQIDGINMVLRIIDEYKTEREE